MSSKLTLKYELHRAGWATAHWIHGEELAMTVSYLHDSLGDLVNSALQLRAGVPDARVVFMDEPGEHQLHLRAEDNDLQYEVRWYSDWESWGMHPSDRFKTVAKGTVSRGRYRHQVLNVLRKIHSNIGVEKYRELWVNHDFPLDEYRALEKRSFAEQWR